MNRWLLLLAFLALVVPAVHAGDLPAEAAHRLEVSSVSAMASVSKRVNPKYPPIAVAGKVEGPVTMEVVVGKDGKVISVKPLNGNPVLLVAAMDAVKQWQFHPFEAKGEPVEIQTEVTLHFELNKR
jgi:TonB family protein